MATAAQVTSIALAASVPTLSYGQTETLTATVTAPVGTPTGGTVTFLDGSATLGAAPLTHGTAAFSTSTLTAGTHNITATYSGASGFGASRSSLEPTTVPTTMWSAGSPAAVAAEAAGVVFIGDQFINRVVKVTWPGTESTVATGVSLATADSAGNVYVRDASSVTKVTPAGVKSAVGTGLSNPYGVGVDATGNVFIADVGHGRVVRVTPGGTQTVVASGLNGAGQIALDGLGDLFINDYNNERVLEVTPGGTQTTVGSGLSHPSYVTADSAGNAYIIDSYNTRIVKVSPAGIQTTVITGLTDALKCLADSAGDLIVLNSYGTRVLKIAASGVQTTLAPGMKGAADIALDGLGDLFIADNVQYRVLKVTPGVSITVNHEVTTTALAASATTLPSGQTLTLTATVAGSPTTPTGGMVSFLDGTTVLGTSDLVNGAATFSTSTLPPGTHQISASYGGTDAYLPSHSLVKTEIGTLLYEPQAVGVDATGNVFISQVGNSNTGQLVKVTPGGTQSILITSPHQGGAVAVDTKGNVFMADTWDATILKAAPDGTVSVAVTGIEASGLAVDAMGNIYASESHTNRVEKIAQDGTRTTIAAGLNLQDNNLHGVASDPSGDVYIADTYDHVVLRVAPDGTRSVVAPAQFAPTGVAVDSHGNLYVADPDLVSTPGGETDGPNAGVYEIAPDGSRAKLATGPIYPWSVAVDTSNNLYIVGFGDRVTKQTPALAVRVTTAAPVAPVITWNPASFTYGTTLGAAQLNATANTSGSFCYSPPAGTVMRAGDNQTLSLTFTPTDTADYLTVTTTARIDVQKASPDVRLDRVVTIVHGTPLDNSQLPSGRILPPVGFAVWDVNGLTTYLSGRFVYKNPGTVLPSGNNQMVTVMFIPDDTTDFAPVDTFAYVTVLPAPAVPQQRPRNRH